MRKLLIAGNWKMNMTAETGVALARKIAEESPAYGAVDLLVCPPAVYLASVREALAGGDVFLGGQNMHHESSGAFTGEISPGMLRDVGATFVILGHSERRHIFGERDEAINKKAHAAHAAGLTPIVCVGETLDQRKAGQTAAVIEEQFAGSLAGLSDQQMAATVIAYEPVWAIGTGQVATPEQAQQVHADLRKLLGSRYNAEVAQEVRILYGGSVKPDNAGSLLALADVDGALVGGACLKADDFLAIAAAGVALAPDDENRPPRA
ncbi:MAG TPA: triose-phosphate isomerase [Lacipirellulaceae bacterium]|nr:triose-phosphate isomerase [Lacipirellulaceae bacterium]